MNATDRTHTLETLFSSLSETHRGTEKYRRLLEKIRQSITDPRRITGFRMLSDDSPVVREAYAVSDALESVSNGMYNPDALAGIAEIGEDSPLYYWQRFIYALLSFYQNDRDNMHQFLDHIPEEAPPANLKPVLLNLCEGRPIENPTKKQRELIRNVKEDRSCITSAVEQLEEYLEADMQESFAETAVLFIKDLIFSRSGTQQHGAHRLETAKRLAVSCLSLSGEESRSFFVEQLQLIFGETEGNRLVALALMEDSPDVSILFWIRLTLKRLRTEAISRETAEAHLSIVGDLAVRILEDMEPEMHTQDPDNRANREYFEGLAYLSRKLVDELALHFGGTPGESGLIHRLTRIGGSDTMPDTMPEREPDRTPEQELNKVGNRESTQTTGDIGSLRRLAQFTVSPQPSPLEPSPAREGGAGPTGTPGGTVKSEPEQLELF